MSASDSVIVEERLYVGFDAGASDRPAADPAFLARLKTGDRLAFEQLVVDYQGLVFGLAYRLLGDAEEARDISQETFLRAYRYIGTFRGDCEIKTWLYRLTVNQVSNHRRWWRRRRRSETVSLDASINEHTGTLADMLESSGRTPEQDTLGRERQRILLAALETLRQDYRVAIVLRDIEELPYEEIAIALSVPVGTVKSRIARGREELRKRLLGSGVQS